ncbi:VOC family protein [Streptomyces sp. enrichment culture]|uniref:VOC family protein n=1 Tax=Streptomyces sp. enrichment culture TaxID=1795815 RepID=UPI003F566772
MDVKTHEVSRTAAFFSEVLGWHFAVDEDDWRRAIRIFADGQQIGGVSDLSSPLYPPGTPAHIAYYLAVDDIDARTEAATAAGAQLVLAPFDAGDQGRIATLIDPVGAAFSLWQTHPSNRWSPSTRAPRRMVLACPRPERARRFYRDVLGAVPSCADFVPVPAFSLWQTHPSNRWSPSRAPRRMVLACPRPEPARRSPSGPRWELVVSVDDPKAVAARARGLGHGMRDGQDHVGEQRLTGPDGLTFRIRAAAS